MAPNIEPKQMNNKSPLRKETGSAEIYFAKRLANNEKKIRDKSLKRLHHWLASRQKAENVLSEDEWLKVWKGLFYCMWFSDKPLIQEELAENVSKLIHIFKGTESGILFAKEFLITMGREWMGIDRLRLDKFYMLIKKVYQQLFEFLCESEWDLSLVNRISSFLKGIFIHEQFPVGLKLHLSEYFIPVLKSFVVERSEDVPVDRFLELISPYLLLLARCKSPAVTKVVEEEVLEKLDELAQNDKEGGACTLKIPYADLAEELSTLAADKLVQTKNRKILHAFINKFQALQKQLQESEEQIPQKTKKAKRKRKPNAELADPKSSDNPVIVESIESSAKAAKKKKQKKEKKTITVVKTQDGSELSD